MCMSEAVCWCSASPLPYVAPLSCWGLEVPNLHLPDYLASCFAKRPGSRRWWGSRRPETEQPLAMALAQEAAAAGGHQQCTVATVALVVTVPGTTARLISPKETHKWSEAHEKMPDVVSY